MKEHMEVKQAEKLHEYNQSRQEEKESFFECIFPFKSTVNSHLGGSHTQLQFSANKDILNVLIGEMLFNPSGYGGVAASQERSLAAFADLATADEIQNSDGELHTDL